MLAVTVGREVPAVPLDRRLLDGVVEDHQEVDVGVTTPGLVTSDTPVAYHGVDDSPESRSDSSCEVHRGPAVGRLPGPGHGRECDRIEHTSSFPGFRDGPGTRESQVASTSVVRRSAAAPSGSSVMPMARPWDAVREALGPGGRSWDCQPSMGIASVT